MSKLTDEEKDKLIDDAFALFKMTPEERMAVKEKNNSVALLSLTTENNSIVFNKIAYSENSEYMMMLIAAIMELPILIRQAIIETVQETMPPHNIVKPKSVLLQ